MISIYFSEESWTHFVMDNRREGADAVLAELYHIEAAEAAKKMYEEQIMEKRAELQNIFDEVYSDDDGPSWRTEDNLGGE